MATVMYPAPVMMPITMLQNMNTVSIGSLIAVRKRTMESAPTMPSESTTLERTVKMASAVTIESITSESAKALAEADAAVGHAVDHQHEQTQRKAQQERREQRADGDRGEFLNEFVFDEIGNAHWFYPSLFRMSKHLVFAETAQRCFVTPSSSARMAREGTRRT